MAAPCGPAGLPCCILHSQQRAQEFRFLHALIYTCYFQLCVGSRLLNGREVVSRCGFDCVVSQVAPVVKNPPASAGDIRDVGSIPGSGRSPGEGNGDPLQDSCLENALAEEPGGRQSTGSEVVRQAWHGSNRVVVCTGLTVLRHVGSSWAKNGICNPCIDRWILGHQTAREALTFSLFLF